MLDVASREHDFPSLRNFSYLNTAAEGVPPLVVGRALQQYFQDKQLGMDGRDRHFAQLAVAQQEVAKLYGLAADEVAICSCTSEAYNLAALALRLKDGDEVIVNDLDFPAGATPWLQQASRATVKLWRTRVATCGRRSYSTAWPEDAFGHDLIGKFLQWIQSQFVRTGRCYTYAFTCVAGR